MAKSIGRTVGLGAWELLAEGVTYAHLQNVGMGKLRLFFGTEPPAGGPDEGSFEIVANDQHIFSAENVADAHNVYARAAGETTRVVILTY